jgi:hypothetical protein
LQCKDAVKKRPKGLFLFEKQGHMLRFDLCEAAELFEGDQFAGAFVVGFADAAEEIPRGSFFFTGNVYHIFCVNDDTGRDGIHKKDFGFQLWCIKDWF